MQIEGVKRRVGNDETSVRFHLTVKRERLHRKTQAFILTVIIGVFPSSAVAARPGGQLSAQLAGALALSATAFSPGQVEWARAGLAAAASLQMVRVEAAGRW